jgi:hypothetical protein
MAELRERAAALAGELIALKREVALSGDNNLNQKLKEVTRILKHPRGEFSEEAYGRLVERLTEELYGEADAQERAVRERKASLTANVRRGVVAELAGERAELRERERLVSEREAQARPSYRARFFAAGAGLTLTTDVLLRLVA